MKDMPTTPGIPMAATAETGRTLTIGVGWAEVWLGAGGRQRRPLNKR